MMWSDKAFGIYMGEAGTVTPLEAITSDSDSRDVLVNRYDAGNTDHCSDGDTQRTSWLPRSRSLTDTQVHSVARG